MRSVAVTVLVLALLVATTAAFALTEALKLERSPVTAPRFDRLFSPTCACATSTARLALRLREHATVDAVIVDDDGDPVRTLATNAAKRKGPVVFEWDGRDDAGDVVADGRYRLRVHLAEQRRTIVIPNPIRVDTEKPRVELVRVRQRAFSPDGDKRNDRLRILYRTTERGRPLLFVDGIVIAEGTMRPAGRARLVWGGRFAGRLARPAAHRVWVRVRDRAGNVSEPTTPIRVRVRYIELTRRSFRVRKGGVLRFRVVTDGAYSWALVRPGRRISAAYATGKVVAVRIPAVDAFPPGRYVLRVVAATGRRDASVVRVLPARP